MQVGASVEPALWTTFTAKAELVGASVLRAASDEALRHVLDQAGEQVVATASLASRLPDLASPPAEPETAPEVAVAGLFAVAETCSVALNEPQHDRAACFLAERVWVVVRAEDIVATLDEALQRLRDLVVRDGARHPLLMTGPSRTADIERVLTVGVHGPRALTILIVSQA